MTKESSTTGNGQHEPQDKDFPFDIEVKEVRVGGRNDAYVQVRPKGNLTFQGFEVLELATADMAKFAEEKNAEIAEKSKEAGVECKDLPYPNGLPVTSQSDFKYSDTPIPQIKKLGSLRMSLNHALGLQDMRDTESYSHINDDEKQSAAERYLHEQSFSLNIPLDLANFFVKIHQEENPEMLVKEKITSAMAKLNIDQPLVTPFREKAEEIGEAPEARVTVDGATPANGQAIRSSKVVR